LIEEKKKVLSAGIEMVVGVTFLASQQKKRNQHWLCFFL